MPLSSGCVTVQRRDIFIPGIHSTPSLEAQKARFTSAGWTGRVEALDMFRIHSGLDVEDVQRANRLEIFDEFEEWQLIQVGHSWFRR
jgi:tRNA wybutosine-synthesizing protein 4